MLPDEVYATATSIFIVKRKPAHDKIDVNSYNVKVLTTKSCFMPLEKHVVVHYAGPSDSAKRPAKRPRGFQVNGVDTASGLQFGEMSSETMAEALAAPPPQTAKTDAVPPTAAAQPTAPKAKPASWAALVGGGRTVTPVASQNAGPSSSNGDQSDIEALTPRSSTQSLPPVSSSSSKNAPRPVINYAAAAAASKHLSSQEDLIKLLTEGMRGRPKEAIPFNTPRGLINTGNMCFANTVS